MGQDKDKERNPNAATPADPATGTPADPNRQGQGPTLPGQAEPKDLPDTEASPDTDVATTDAALEEGAPTSSGAIDQDAAEEAGENAGG